MLEEEFMERAVAEHDLFVRRADAPEPFFASGIIAPYESGSSGFICRSLERFFRSRRERSLQIGFAVRRAIEDGRSERIGRSRGIMRKRHARHQGIVSPVWEIRHARRHPLCRGRDDEVLHERAERQV